MLGSGAIGLIVCAHGAPRDRQEVLEMLTRMRKGKPPTREELETVVARYEETGWSSPLNEATETQAQAMGKRLSEALGVPVLVRVGFKYVPPLIEEAVAQLSRAASRVCAAVMSTYLTRPGALEYAERLRAACAESPVGTPAPLLSHLALLPELADFFARNASQKLEDLAAKGVGRDKVVLLFTAHSLPLQGSNHEDYRRQRSAFIDQIMGRISPPRPRFVVGYQSVGLRGSKWLGPRVEEVVAGLSGCEAVLVVPDGFVSEHLEILYDLDIALRHTVEGRGLAYSRTDLPGADEAVVTAAAGWLAQRISGLATG
jgi:ferrochelatase